MRRHKGFTLIELLVVIAVIALLLAILMPSLQIAKRMAQGVVCLTNTKGLSLGWVLYTEDYDGRVPHCSPGTASNRWVKPPTTFDLEGRIAGIEAGALYPYVKEHKQYHCLGDRRFQGVHGNYLSYAMPASLGTHVKKVTQISHIQEKYIFVEESDTRRYMNGGWSLGVKDINRDGWWDGLAVWHNKASTFGFGDGHADKHKWVNDETIERANRDLTGGGAYGYKAWSPGEPREDLDWLQLHWPSPIK